MKDFTQLYLFSASSYLQKFSEKDAWQVFSSWISQWQTVGPVMETPQRYQNLTSGFEDQQSSFQKEQIWGVILSSLHPRGESQALKSKGNIPKPQWRWRFQRQLSAVIRVIRVIRVGWRRWLHRSSFRPLRVLVWDLLPPSFAESLMNLLPRVFSKVCTLYLKHALLQIRLIPMLCAKASILPSLHWKCLFPTSWQYVCLSHTHGSDILLILWWKKQGINHIKTHNMSWGPK